MSKMKEIAIMLEELEIALKQHDWGYQYSDDHRVWSRGQSQRRAITAQIKELENLGFAKEAKIIVDRYKEVE